MTFNVKQVSMRFPKVYQAVQPRLFKRFWFNEDELLPICKHGETCCQICWCCSCSLQFVAWSSSITVAQKKILKNCQPGHQEIVAWTGVGETLSWSPSFFIYCKIFIFAREIFHALPTLFHFVCKFANSSHTQEMFVLCSFFKIFLHLFLEYKTHENKFLE